MFQRWKGSAHKHWFHWLDRDVSTPGNTCLTFITTSFILSSYKNHPFSTVNVRHLMLITRVQCVCTCLHMLMDHIMSEYTYCNCGAANFNFLFVNFARCRFSHNVLARVARVRRVYYFLQYRPQSQIAEPSDNLRLTSSKVSENRKIFTAPVGSAACRWVWGTCDQCSVAATKAAAAAGEGFDEPFEEPTREIDGCSTVSQWLEVDLQYSNFPRTLFPIIGVNVSHYGCILFALWRVKNRNYRFLPLFFIHSYSAQICSSLENQIQHSHMFIAPATPFPFMINNQTCHPEQTKLEGWGWGVAAQWSRNRSAIPRKARAVFPQRAGWAHTSTIKPSG